MPFKKQIIDYLDIADQDVIDYQSCNTIVIKNKLLHGYNTDLEGIRDISKRLNYSKVSILGNGSIGKMFYKLLNNLGYDLKIYSRSLNNWDQRHDDSFIVINCTALGTINNTSPLELINDNVKIIVDLSIKTGLLFDQAKEKGIYYISGQDFYKAQFMKQFFLYTGIQPKSNDYDKIAMDRL